MEDLLADPENDEWSSLSSEFCGGRFPLALVTWTKRSFFSEKNIEYWVLLKFTGTHITNTREAKAFALL